MSRTVEQFFCPYCKAWITDVTHEQHHHNDSDQPDEIRDWSTRRVPARDTAEPTTKMPGSAGQAARRSGDTS